MLYLFIVQVACLTFISTAPKRAREGNGTDYILHSIARAAARTAAGYSQGDQSGARLCMDDTINVRTGYLRYLKGSTGEEFVAIHFD